VARRIELIFDETGTRVIAEMQEEFAPRTCDAIWAGLAVPMHVKGIHAMFAGREIMLAMPKENQLFDPTAIPAENQTITPLPGELLWFHFPAHAELGFPDEIYDFAIIYGRDTRMLIPQGWIPGNVFAAISEGLPGFAKCCELVRTEGLKWFTVQRYSE
jgi:hypothetical protein